jgi:ATP-dependent Lhr-like helicase
MLTSKARESLRDVETVIVDEIHAVASTKRGSHLALSLERLDLLLARPAQRIGLSATVRPAEEVARFLGGGAPVTVVNPPSERHLDVEVRVPIEDMTDPPISASDTGARTGSIWPHVEEAIVDQILAHRSTIVFVNSRRLAERLTAKINEIHALRQEAPDGDEGAGPEDAPPVLARAHHGSVAHAERERIEDDLKRGVLRCVVATSSLELGIDMGEVDLVIHVEAPPSVAAGMQRIGRAGHQVGGVSHGLLYPKHRADLVHAAVAAERMRSGLIEKIHIPSNPLDILAQQTVAAAAMDDLHVDTWFAVVRRCASFQSLTRSVFDATLDMLAGRYPSDAFAELRPRIVWDRDTGRLVGRPGAARLAVTNGGTIPDRGAFGVFIAGAEDSGSGRGARGTRVGELDEEMVYESRVGDVFALGATSWRIQEITHDRVNVIPAFGEPGRTPFWHGDAPGRPAESGMAIGAFERELAAHPDTGRLAEAGLGPNAAANLLAYLAEQKAAAGLPTDRMLVVEQVRDELGDWRVILHSPYGMQVHAPWALAVGRRVRERYGLDGNCVATDDGIIVRVPEGEGEVPGAELFVFEAEELPGIVTDEVGASALFAARFRECAARGLLLPRYRPGMRSPLWQQRQKASQLLDVARAYPTFPIILETVRECVNDVYDLNALTALMGRIAGRTVRLTQVTTAEPSPFARSLLFGYVASFMYEGDNPLAERRAAALTVDSALLADLLGQVELRELLDPQVIADLEDSLQFASAGHRLRADVEGVADLVRILGPLTVEEIAARLEDERREGSGASDGSEASSASGTPSLPGRGEGHVPPQVHVTFGPTQAGGLVASLVRGHRAVEARIGERRMVAAIEDVARLRDALGIPAPPGIAHVFTEPVADPLGDLVGRYARTHGPFTAGDLASRFGLGTAAVLPVLARLKADGRLVEGEFRPNVHGMEWCDAQVLRRIRRLCLAALRHEVEPVDQVVFSRFLPAWQHTGSHRLRGVDGLLAVIEQLEGVPLPASAWESLVLPARIVDYLPSMLDALTSSGEILWAGSGALSDRDGWVSLHTAQGIETSLSTPGDDDAAAGRVHVEPATLDDTILAALDPGGAFFFRQLSDTVGSLDDSALAAALWRLVWAGEVTNDTFAPLRSLVGPHSTHKRRTPPHSRLYRAHPFRLAVPRRGGPAMMAGRWSRLPRHAPDPTVDAHARAERLLDRYGLVTRGAVMAEGAPGGFHAIYRVLSALEEAGRVRRGYFVTGLGAAQFAVAATVDRLRAAASPDPEPQEPVVLAATDPANPFGAALPWPPVRNEDASSPVAHRPARKAGAVVVVSDGVLLLYMERGGKTMLTFATEPAALEAATRAVAKVVAEGRLAPITVQKVDGAPVTTTDAAQILRRAGFSEVPQGLRIRP